MKHNPDPAARATGRLLDSSRGEIEYIEVVTKSGEPPVTCGREFDMTIKQRAVK